MARKTNGQMLVEILFFVCSLHWAVASVFGAILTVLATKMLPTTEALASSAIPAVYHYLPSVVAMLFSIIFFAISIRVGLRDQSRNYR